jgi:predicted CXXCH cytochrome family protein
LNPRNTFKKTSFILFFPLFFAAPHISSLAAEKKEIVIVPGATCISANCHPDRGKDEYTHYVSSDGFLCIACHKVAREGEHTFELRAKASELCFRCHDGKKYGGNTLHGPVTQGKCLECHRPHGSNNPAHLQANQPELCFGCHATGIKDNNGIFLPSTKELFNNKAMELHKPFAEGKCAACHLPHAADGYRRVKGNYTAQFYVSYSDVAHDSCLRCHEPLRRALSQPRTLTGTAFRNGDLNLHYKHVNRVKGRTCRTCHHHHGSSNPKLVRETFVFGKTKLAIEYERTESGGRCAPACHVPVRYDRYGVVVKAMTPVPEKTRGDVAKEMKLSHNRDSARIEVEQAK